MHIKNPSLIVDKRARWIIYGIGLLAVVLFLSGRSFSLSSNNDFDTTNALIPVDEIYHGGPSRDGIPSIDKPQFVKAAEVDFLKPGDTILGLEFEGVVRAYPVKILNYHEIVNDRINGQAVVISYCPLCGSGLAFKPELSEADNTFGVSGLLYNSDMLLYDRLTESLWSQIMAKAISGKLRGSKLFTLGLETTTWAHWLQQHPGTEVLSTNTGYSRNYQRHPYADYDNTHAIYFPVANTSARYHPKERVIGLTVGNKARAWPISELAKQNKTIIKDMFAGERLTIQYNDASQSAVIMDAEQNILPAINLFWFAWVAFHPETEVYVYSQSTR